jgi:hypothetical protein
MKTNHRAIDRANSFSIPRRGFAGKILAIFLPAAFIVFGVLSERIALGEERHEAARATGGAGYEHAGAADHRVESPGVGTPGVKGVGAGARGAGVAPGVGVGSPGVGALPRGYYHAVPVGWAKAYYGGYWCACVNGVYYRPVYYQGVVVYVVV